MDSATGGGRRCRRSSRCGSRSSAGSALVAVRDRLPPALVPAGALGRQVPRPRRRTTRCASSPSRRRAARSSTATARCWSATAPRSRCSSSTTELPRSRERRARLLRAPRRGRRADARRGSATRSRAERKECAGEPRSRCDRDVSYDTVYYLRENQQRFPGVSVERVYVRRLPAGHRSPPTSSATSGEVDPKELKDPRYESLEPGDQVGKAGVEFTYDSLLRGVNGVSRVQVDASGRPTGGTLLARREPRTGNDLVLTIDDAVQRGRPGRDRRLGLPGRVRGDERQQRRAARAGLEPVLRPVGVREAAGPAGDLQVARLARRPARRCSTARPTASIRPARPSSRSPRWRRSTRATIGLERDHQRHRRVPARRRPGAPQRR